MKENSWKAVWEGQDVWDYIWEKAHSHIVWVMLMHICLWYQTLMILTEWPMRLQRWPQLKSNDPVLMNLDKWAHKQSGLLDQK